MRSGLFIETAPNDQNHTKESAGVSVLLPVDFFIATALECNINKDDSTAVCTNRYLWTVQASAEEMQHGQAQ